MARDVTQSQEYLGEDTLNDKTYELIKVVFPEQKEAEDFDEQFL